MARINARKLRKTFASVVKTFADTQGPAFLHSPVRAWDGEGGVKTTFAAPKSCTAVRVNYEHRYRVASNIPSTDVRILLARDGLNEEVTLDHQITVEGKRFKIIDPIGTDPINAVYDLQGRPV